MWDEKGAWWVSVGPNGQEQVTVGTPEFPVEMWGPWDCAEKKDAASRGTGTRKWRSISSRPEKKLSWRMEKVFT